MLFIAFVAAPLVHIQRIFDGVARHMNCRFAAFSVPGTVAEYYGVGIRNLAAIADGADHIDININFRFRRIDKITKTSTLGKCGPPT